MIKKKCRYCNNLNDENAKYCSVCGASLFDAEVIDNIVDAEASKTPEEPKKEQNPSHTTYDYNARTNDFENKLNKTLTEGNALAIASIFCAFIFPLMGMIVGVLALARCANGTFRKLAKAGILLSVIFMVITIVAITIFIIVDVMAY